MLSPHSQSQTHTLPPQNPREVRALLSSEGLETQKEALLVMEFQNPLPETPGFLGEADLPQVCLFLENDPTLQQSLQRQHPSEEAWRNGKRLAETHGKQVGGTGIPADFSITLGEMGRTLNVQVYGSDTHLFCLLLDA